MKIYYKEWTQLMPISMEDAWHCLVKSSVHSEKMLGNHHFVDFLKQIWRPSAYKNQNRIDKLLAKTKQYENLADREWIIEKLEALQ